MCPVDAYRKRDFDRTQFVDTIDEICRDCYRCVQGCPRGLIFKALNPFYRQLGDDYWTPEIIATTWYQAETGKIPVSGAGYGGVFAGEGFDSLWTDMSEIVRPTRDGIHGREYISTTIDLGRKPMFLAFDDQGELVAGRPLPCWNCPCRWCSRNRPWGRISPRLRQIIAQAAQTLGTLAIIRPGEHHPGTGRGRGPPGAVLSGDPDPARPPAAPVARPGTAGPPRGHRAAGGPEAALPPTSSSGSRSRPTSRPRTGWRP